MGLWLDCSTVPYREVQPPDYAWLLVVPWRDIGRGVLVTLGVVGGAYYGFRLLGRALDGGIYRWLTKP